ncbi:N-acetylmuramoyl-L-alanine amidase [Georgenia subflava]|uniref:Peptidoglycan recognition protein family domain-containing protein n=1 Tax=Georgenia subflava TaxID=1622177 RepID=A0A6N7EKI4_9MICO|nr:N-acetylmuramoyl-L-alanine amidase [Georgenia subflava]MPV37598.1 hypothetical protein [Georgenia subflava]
MLVRRTTATAAVTGLILATVAALPAQAETGASEAPPEPVTVIPLTDGAGTRTEVAVEGIDRLGDAATHTADGSVEAAGLRVIGGGAGIATVRGMMPATGAQAADLDKIAVLTEPIATAEFMVAGLTWENGEHLPMGSRVFLRVLEDGGWSDWLETETEAGADAEVGGDAARVGTDPFVTGGAEAVQIQVTGDAAELPASLEVSLIPANPDVSERVVDSPSQPRELPESEATATTEPAAFTSLGTSSRQVVTVGYTTASTVPTATTVATKANTVATANTLALAPTSLARRPAITSRSGWGADESIMTWPRQNAPLKATVVHHTAGTNNYGPAESASIVRGIYRYHTVSRQWGDIGYNFLIDKWGNIFEGRSGSLAAPAGQMVVAGHARPFNTSTMGVSVMGNFAPGNGNVPPARQAPLYAMSEVIAWQYSRAGIDMDSPSGLISNGTPTRPAGQNLPRIFGHKEVSATSCPGLFQGDLSALSATVDAKLPQLFYLNNSFSPTADVSFRYGPKGTEVFVGDWDGDGIDTIAVRSGTVFSVNNSNAFTDTADVVFAYGKPGDVILVGDWDGDGKDTLAVRRGREYHVRNSVTSGPADKIVAYGKPEDQVLVGDWDGEGQDTFAVRRGAQYFVKNSIAPGEADQTVVYGKSGDTVMVGDWNGNGLDTLAVRRGAEYHIKNSIAPGRADIQVVYGRPADLVVVGDWNGDDKDTLGVRRP